MINLLKLVNDYRGIGESIVVPNSRKLTNGFEINISKYSGLVSVLKRRSSKKIANIWSQNIFAKKFSDKKSFGKFYTAKIPAVIARQTYCLETILLKLKIKSKSICDIGAGEGDFLKMLNKRKIASNLFAIEPSKRNCQQLTRNKIKNFQGTIEDFSNQNQKFFFDILTVMWTMCNTSDPNEVLKSAHKLCKKNGYIVIAESSRILVPFKKPIQMYIGKGNPDNHAFHFSKNSLCNLLVLNKFRPVYVNRYIDSDCLLVIAKKINYIETKNLKVDNFKKVKLFFSDWYKDSKKYKSELL